jgi:hypothetical protein
LEPYRNLLEFKPEHQLTAEPLRIDLLIIYTIAGDNPVKYTDADGKLVIPWPLVIKILVPIVGAILTTKAMNDTKKHLDSRPGNSMVDPHNVLKPSSLSAATSGELTVTESRKFHEDKTYGKVENEIKAELGRKLNPDETDRWHREIERATKEKIKNGEAPKGETNPSLTEEELRDTARDSLGVEL